MPRIITPIIETFGIENYQFQYLTSSVAIATATEIARRAAPVFASIMEQSGNPEAQFKKTDYDNIFVALGSALDVEAVSRLIQTLCSVVISTDGVLSGGVFEEHFKGRPGLALKVASKSFEVNCGDFFENAVNLGGGLMKVTTQAPVKSTGGSGVSSSKKSQR